MGELDGADRFAMEELLNRAMVSPLPQHTRTMVTSDASGQSGFAQEACPGSGKTPEKTYLEHAGDPEHVTSIRALCPGSCAAYIEWDYAASKWKVT